MHIGIISTSDIRQQTKGRLGYYIVQFYDNLKTGTVKLKDSKMKIRNNVFILVLYCIQAFFFAFLGIMIWVLVRDSFRFRLNI